MASVESGGLAGPTMNTGLSSESVEGNDKMLLCRALYKEY